MKYRKTITFRWLEEEGACDEALELFAERFGRQRRVPVREVVIALWRSRIDELGIYDLSRTDWGHWLLDKLWFYYRFDEQAEILDDVFHYEIQQATLKRACKITRRWLQRYIDMVEK